MRKLKFLASVLTLSTLFSMNAFAADCHHINVEVVAETEATCDSKGYTEGIFCNDCSRYISGHRVISPLGHIDANNDGYCDDCKVKFEVRDKKEATCTADGYTGDKKQGDRVILGEVILAKGHKDKNEDFICDICKQAIKRETIEVTLHYYILKEEYENNKEKYSGKNFKVKDSNDIAGCKYVTETRTEVQNIPFEVPEAPSVKGYNFVWTKGTTVYKTFSFNADTELYMSYVDKNSKSLEGQAGPNAYYIYHPETKTLEFTGSGYLWNDFKAKAEIPWYKFLSQSDSVYMEDGLKASLWTIIK